MSQFKHPRCRSWSFISPHILFISQTEREKHLEDNRGWGPHTFTVVWGYSYIYTRDIKNELKTENVIILRCKTDVDERGDRVGDRRKLSSSAKLTSTKHGLVSVLDS